MAKGLIVLRIVPASKCYCCKVCNLAMWVISLLENAKHEARPTQVGNSTVFIVCINFIAMITILSKRLGIL